MYPVTDAAIRLLPFNSSCFEYPRVELSLPSGSKWQAFLNPATGVVSSTAPAADCASTSPFYLLANGSLIRFSALDGKVIPVSMQGIETIRLSFTVRIGHCSPKANDLPQPNPDQFQRDRSGQPA
ncbi:unnamed protein product, partial [Heligmosomoides polygyrus]|uniref:ZP domain-containing protein n=1 Tax=Heligmosomoides polygyrus TaxID=6339 RepID=A0A183FCV9_HELPZ